MKEWRNVSEFCQEHQLHGILETSREKEETERKRQEVLGQQSLSKLQENSSDHELPVNFSSLF